MEPTGSTCFLVKRNNDLFQSLEYQEPKDIICCSKYHQLIYTRCSTLPYFHHFFPQSNHQWIPIINITDVTNYMRWRLKLLDFEPIPQITRTIREFKVQWLMVDKKLSGQNSSYEQIINPQEWSNQSRASIKIVNNIRSSKIGNTWTICWKIIEWIIFYG